MSKYIFPSNESSLDGFFVGIDCSGHKTFARIFDYAGNVISENYAKKAHFIQGDISKACTYVVASIVNAALIKNIPIESLDIKRIVVSVPGLDHAFRTKQIADQLRRHGILRKSEVRVMSHLKALFLGMIENDSGLIVNSGTKNHVLALHGRVHSYCVGSYSTNRVISDHIINTMHDGYRQHSKSDFGESIRSYFDIESLANLPDSTAYFSDTERSEVANAVTGIAIDHAERGDSLAQDSLFESANRFAESTNVTIRRLDLKEHEFPVGLSGQIWSQSSLFTSHYTEAVRDTAKKAVFFTTSYKDATKVVIAPNRTLDLI